MRRLRIEGFPNGVKRNGENETDLKAKRVWHSFLMKNGMYSFLLTGKP
jgi:hypothetical protein